MKTRPRRLHAALLLWFLILAPRPGVAGVAASAVKAGGVATLPPMVLREMSIQLFELAPNLGNPGAMAQSLLREISPLSPDRIQAEPSRLAAALILKRTLTERAAYALVEPQLREHWPLEHSLMLAQVKGSIEGDPAAREIFQRAFASVERALSPDQPLEKIGGALDAFFTGSAPLKEGDLSDGVLAETAVAMGWQPVRKIHLALNKPSRPGPKSEPSVPGPWLAKAAPGEVLFVCTGNTCRSPIAEEAFNALAKKNPAVEARAISRGLLAAGGTRADGHESRQLSELDVRRARVIISMDEINALDLVRRFPQAYGKTFLLKDYAGTGTGDVPDPYGQPVDSYWGASREIFTAIEAIWSQALPGRRDAKAMWSNIVASGQARWRKLTASSAPAPTAPVTASTNPKLRIGTVHVKFRESADPDPRAFSRTLDSVQARSFGRNGLFAKSRQKWEAELAFAHVSDAERAVNILKTDREVAEILVHPGLEALMGRREAEFPVTLGPEESPGTIRVLFAPGVPESKARGFLSSAGAPEAQLIMNSERRLEAFSHFSFAQDAARTIVRLKRIPSVAAVAAHRDVRELSERASALQAGPALAPVFSMLPPELPLLTLRVIFQDAILRDQAEKILGAYPRRGLQGWEGELYFKDAKEFVSAFERLRRDPSVQGLEVRPEVAAKIADAEKH